MEISSLSEVNLTFVLRVICDSNISPDRCKELVEGTESLPEKLNDLQGSVQETLEKAYPDLNMQFLPFS